MADSSSGHRLPHDCFATGEALLPVADALALLEARAQCVVGVEGVPLAEAAGRVLATDVTARVTVPPHDNSAVDGYAVRGADLSAEAPVRLPVVRRVAAGDPPGDPVAPGQAVRIFTGAPLPPGLDTIAMQEDCTAEDGAVVLPAGLKTGANRRCAGEDVAAGAVVLSAGRRLRAADLGMAASVGYPRLEVRKRLRVALFSTGDELREPGEPLPPGCIYNANRYGMRALLEDQGCVVHDGGILPDRAAVVRAALSEAAAHHHLVITSGGVSMGEEDHVKAVVEALGRLHFWRLAVKPGRPAALGTIGGAAFLGVPGNPVAALVSFLLLGRTLVHRLQGRTPQPLRRYRLPAAFDFAKRPGRQEFIRVWLEDGPDGPVVHAFPSQGSGVLSSMVRADGLVDIARDGTGVRAGDMVDYIPFAEALA